MLTMYEIRRKVVLNLDSIFKAFQLVVNTVFEITIVANRAT